MVTDIIMPQLGESIAEGTVVKWLVPVGGAIQKDESLLEVETEKVTLEIPSPATGLLDEIIVHDGQTVPVGTLLARVESAPPSGVINRVGGVVIRPMEPASAGDQHHSPAVRQLAREHGIDLSQVKGTGVGGRVTKKDVLDVIAQSRAQTEIAAPGSEPSMGEDLLAFTQMRKTIAKRLAESKFAAPHFYLTMEINMDNAMTARAAMNEVSDVKISFNDMVVKAAAMALRKHPAVNSSWMGDFIRQYQHIHVGVAVAIEEGLIVPVIRFADQKTLSQIAAESKELAGKARNKKLQPNEFSGNTFTVSNLGMMDIEEFTAIINPPDSAIMAVGRIKEVVVRRKAVSPETNDSFGVSNVMKITLSCDHRSVDGAVGAAFLQTFKKYMENPVTMLV